MAVHARWFVVALGLAVSACRITTSGLRVSHSADAAAGTSSTGARTPGPAQNSSGAGSSRPIQVNPYFETRRPGFVSAAVLESLPGVNVDSAMNELKKFGHTGEVHVAECPNTEDCDAHQVCRVVPTHEIRVTDEVTLCIASVAIPPPPPP